MESKSIKMAMFISVIFHKIKNTVEVPFFGLVYANQRIRNKFSSTMVTGGEVYLMEWANIQRIMVFYE